MIDPSDETIWTQNPLEGTPITLSDGRVWIFPAPKLADFRFRLTKKDATLMCRSFEYGDKYNDLVDEYVDAENGVTEAVSTFKLALYLLQVNYKINFNDAAKLLRRASDSASAEEKAVNEEMWTAILEVALGKVPKPIQAG